MGMGKSTFACQMAINAARMGYGVGIVSPDMKRRPTVARLLTALIWAEMQQLMPYKKILRGRLDHMDRDIGHQASEMLEKLPIIIDEKSSPTVAAISSRARDWKRRFRGAGASLDLLIVDHVHNLRASSRVHGRGRTAEVGEISNDLKAVAGDLDVGLCAFSQITEHDKATQEIKRPKLGDLRYADELEQDARWVLFMHRPWYYKAEKEPKRTQFKTELGYNEARAEWEADKAELQDLLELIVAKQNNGETGVATTYCDLAANVISEQRIRR
jgi:replicative DNA helicase